MTYTFGSKIKYTTIYDITDYLTISFFIGNIIVTCGHCLPEIVKFDDPDLKLLYTSGFDTPTEGIELGFIECSKPKLSNPFNIILKKNQKMISNVIHLINDGSKYECHHLITLNKTQFTNVIKLNNGNLLYFYHYITKISLDDNKFSDLIKSDQIILYKSDHYNRKIRTKELEKMKDFKIETDKYHYLTKPSFSGSPLINNKNEFIGYHIGSTMGFMVNPFINSIYWVGNIAYCKRIKII